MGIERIQKNMHPWILRIFMDRAYILGYASSSMEQHFPSEWPWEYEKQCKEIAFRIYDLYNATNKDVTYSTELEKHVALEALNDYVVRQYTQRGKAGYDSDYIEFMVKDPQESLPSCEGRLYVNYDHRDVSASRRLALYLQRELKFKTRGVYSFKIAGPVVDATRRDSAILYLNGLGIRKVAETAATINGLLTTIPKTVFGARPLLPGFGFARSPSPIPASSWKSLYYRADGTSFGGLLSAYLARALRESHLSIDGFSDRFGYLLEQDGINPLLIHELSETTREKSSDGNGI